jgi:hypothetical protein
MSQDHPIYDLGEVDLDSPKEPFPPVFEAPRRRPQPSGQPGPNGATRTSFERSGRGAMAPGPALTGSLSMFVPGLGQMVAGEIAWGLFYVTGFALCAAVVWAVFRTLDSLVPTLGLLGVPVQWVAIALCVLTFGAMGLHLSAVVHAQGSVDTDYDRAIPHPIVAGIASLFVPGWGQLLAAHRRRAALFLGAVWILGVAWLAVTPGVAVALGRIGVALPASFRDGWGPVTLLATPLVVWVVAVYDAAAGAAVERARAS